MPRAAPTACYRIGTCLWMSSFRIPAGILDIAVAVMAFSLKDKETDRLAREMAALTGETLTDAIRIALAEPLDRERLKRGQPGDLAALIRAIGEQFASLPDRDVRSPDEILGHDETGLWH
jgi:antitoxin VapB